MSSREFATGDRVGSRPKHPVNLMAKRFRIGLTRDFLNDRDDLLFEDIGLDLLDGQSNIEWEFMPRATSKLDSDDIAGYDGVLVLAPAVAATSLLGNDRLMVVARFGVGYDAVDVPACTDAGVAVTITPDGVRRPVATALLASVLALALRLKERDRLVRESRWNEKMSFLGTGLTGRTLGIVGFGNIGREFAKIAKPLEMRQIACDPFVTEASAAAADVQLVDLDNLMQESDFVCVCCPLTEATYHLIGSHELGLMKSTAYFINAARGPIVDESALIDVLRHRAIKGAALDVFEIEPLPADSPLLEMDDLLLTPHSIAHTDEGFRLMGQSAIRGLVAAANGDLPSNIVNRDVLRSEEFNRKLGRWAPR